MSRKNNRSQKKQQKRSLRQRGGNCGSNPTVSAKDCMPQVDLNRYRSPCSAVGGARRQRSSRRQQRGGNCAPPVKSCMTGDTQSMVDGAFSQSECAWANRYSVGPADATNSVAVGGARRQKKQQKRSSRRQQRSSRRQQRSSRNRKQRGGQYSLNLVDKIGGLSRVDASYDPYAPSFKNLQVNGPNVSDVKVVDVVPPQNMLGDAMPNESSSALARNSFQIPQCGAGRRKQRSSRSRKQRGGSRRNYLVRRSGNRLMRGGSPADYPSAYNGVQSDFSADMTTRKFDCYQPNWCPKCT